MFKYAYAVLFEAKKVDTRIVCHIWTVAEKLRKVFPKQDASECWKTLGAACQDRKLHLSQSLHSTEFLLNLSSPFVFVIEL